jgi:alkyl hydroperoxide reductase subunit D
MEQMEQLRSGLSEATKDMRLNLTSVLSGEGLTETQRWTVGLCAAQFLRCRPLSEAMRADAGDRLDAAHAEDAKAAAAIMAMNTVYYRTKHQLNLPAYEHLRASLRMNRMVKPATDKATFELCSMACAALAGCEACLKSHEASLRKEGFSEHQVHETIRIAAAIHGFVVAYEAEQPL